MLSSRFSLSRGCFSTHFRSFTKNRINKRMDSTLNIAPTALIPVADGTEEIEATTLADVLVRGGVKVTLAAVGRKENNIVQMSRGLKVQADIAIEACVDRNFDLIVLPGGLPGANHLRDCDVLIQMLKKQKHEGKFYGAICASPAVVLHTHKLLDGPITAYPAFEKEITNVSYKKETVVITGKCITSQGPATAMEMALKLVELLVDKETATKVAKGLLFT